jgi:hypothetical protein
MSSTKPGPRIRRIKKIDNLPEYASWSEMARIMRDSFPGDENPDRFERRQLDIWHRRRAKNGFPELHEVQVEGKLVWSGWNKTEGGKARWLKVSEVLDWYSRYVPPGRGPNRPKPEAEDDGETAA